MKYRLLGAAAAIALAGFGPVAAQSGQQPLQFVDIFSLEMAANPQISPNGDRVVYQRRSNDIMTDQTASALWIVDYDGSDHLPLVTGPGNYSSPVWAPDSERLAFVASENEKTQLRVVWPDRGVTATLATLPSGASNISWSPNGEWLAFTAFVRGPGPQVDIGMPTPPPGADWAESALVDETVRYEFDGVGELPDGGQQIFVISAEGGTPRQLTELAGGSPSAPVWAPNGQELFYSYGGDADTNFDFSESDIYAVSLDGADPRQITDYPGAESSPSISPDGETLAYLGFENRQASQQNTHLFLLELDGGEPRELLPDLDRGIGAAEWDSSGNGLWITYDDRGRSLLSYVGTNGNLQAVTDDLGGLVFGRPYTSGAFSISDNGRFAASIGTANDLANVGVGNRRGNVSVITDLNDDILGQRALARVEEITWTSSAPDGREIQGWIAYPPDFDEDQDYPLILEIHGGPHTAYGPHFSGEVQLYAAAGYVVLYTNPRGSTSYGEDFANLIDKAYPGEDVDDLLSGVDAVVERGFIDSDRLFVTGGSGGGVLTAELIGNDTRFAAAAVAKPVINWTSFILAADIGPTVMPYWFGVTPWEAPEVYWERSPLSHVGDVETPTLVIVGAEDRRTPVFEAEQYYNALQIRGVESRLVRIPGAYHGIADSRPSRLLQKAGHILAWFDAHDPANADN